MSALSCLLKTIFAPFILLYQSIRIYFFGCLGVYLTRAVQRLCCGLCVSCGCTFKDKRFPANAKSIGGWKGKSRQVIEKEVVWRRLADICALAGHSGVKLFSGEVEAADICQGALGDCWLLSAAACLAKYEGAVQRCFLTREYNIYGKYRIRLFDRPNDRWVVVTIDDWIPCSPASGRPLFAQPNGDEGWVLLLEKAFAKLRGSYAALDGGTTLEALDAMTGDNCFRFKQEKTGQWMKWDLIYVPEQGGGSKVALQLAKEQPVSPDRMFETMLTYKRRRSVIAASSGSGQDTQNINGIIQGHAYAVSRVKELEGMRMVQLRNPWGTFEWKGNWSDHSPLWQQYPKIARAVDFRAAEDGMFWMSWQDFCAHFRNIDFCCRTTGWDDLILDVHEECLCCGPTWGCISGCSYFWCACAGLRALFFSKRSKSELIRKKGGCCC